MAELTTVKLPRWLLEGLGMVRARLFQEGIKSLPEHIYHPTICFFCGGSLKQHEHYPQAHCDDCDITLQSIQAPERNAITALSLIIGLGANALIGEISPPERAQKSRQLKAFLDEGK